MLRIRNYLRPYLFMFSLSVVLLFIQANLDLALPDYLSQIVNVGIQQGGVESPVPEAIRKSEMDRLLIFMSEDEATAVLDVYFLVDEIHPDYDAWLAIYPALAEQSIYVLKDDVDQAALDAITPPLAQALVAVSAIEQAVADPEAAAQMSSGSDSGFDLSRIPPGVDLFTVQPPSARKSPTLLTSALPTWAMR